ncbi:MAG: RNA methyltransferase [Chitinophagaceae bacterium]|jgi:TrmH family RNA methyltransferase|nr:RNA methyltransferase [Chitinophagaceae bacterium]
MLLKSRIKYIQSLAHKKSRQEAGEFAVEGPKLMEEFLHAGPSQINVIYALEPWVEANKSLLKKIPQDQVQVISEQDLERISSLQTPNQVLGLVRKPANQTAPQLIEKPVLVLDTIQDPGNLGTMIRTADWFGLEHIVCSHGCADCFNPKVVQSTMGSILRVRISYTDLEPWIRTLGQVPVFATTLEGRNLFSMKPIEAGLILIGNESRGLDPALASLATEQVTIPRKGSAESLNAAVAAGIVLAVLCGE